MEDSGESFMEINVYGNKSWKNNLGQLHRTNGPAIELSSRCKFWYINGKCHRLDGPAIENMAVGYKTWYINGFNLTEEEFDYWSKDWNEEKELMFKLSFS